jgi:hypothetical protein
VLLARTKEHVFDHSQHSASRVNDYGDTQGSRSSRASMKRVVVVSAISVLKRSISTIVTRLLNPNAPHETRTIPRRLAIGFKTIIAATLVSGAAATSARAQLPEWAASNPGTFQSRYPDRDVLNGGALTPAGRMGLELPGGAASIFSNAYQTPRRRTLRHQSPAPVIRRRSG